MTKFLGNGKFACDVCEKTSHNWGCMWNDSRYCDKICRAIDIQDSLK